METEKLTVNRKGPFHSPFLKRTATMKKFIRKPKIVEAAQFDQTGIHKGSQGWQSYNAGDWLVKANGKTWIVEGDVFELLYEPVDVDIA